MFGSQAWTPGVIAAAIALAAPFHAQDARPLVKGTHEELTFERNVERVAVGDPDVLSFEVLDNRSVLVLGKSHGRTSMIVWFDDRSRAALLFAVQPDLSLLRQALSEIHPSLTVDLAPDREALVLRGLVPDSTFSLRAEAAARAYLDAGKLAFPTLVAPGGGAAEAEPVAVAAPEPSTGGAVLNLILLERAPELADVRMTVALAGVAGADVVVHRVPAGTGVDDALDTFVLTGNVRDQVTLTRVLHLAAAALLGSAEPIEIEVVADEAGAIFDPEAGQSSTELQGVLGSFGGSGVFGSGQGGGGQGQISRSLTNRLETNIGRAKILSAAGGRLLSFLEVEDLPQVRVDVRIYEVDRSELFERKVDAVVLASSFDQPGLAPSPLAGLIQGDGAPTVGPDEVQNIAGLLDGTLVNEFQYAGDRFAVDAVFQFLENEGFARRLSSPSLSVLSGELALFQVGGSLPIETAFTFFVGGGDATPLASSVGFVDFGVQLAVRPLVGERGDVTLDVVPQIVFPDAELTAQLVATTGATQPTTALDTRTLKTSSRLKDGQSLVVAGLVTRTRQRDDAGTPFLSTLPVVGWLFGETSRSDVESELVVVLNPVVVREPRPEASLWAFPDPIDLLLARGSRAAVGP